MSLLPRIVLTLTINTVSHTRILKFPIRHTKSRKHSKSLPYPIPPKKISGNNNSPPNEKPSSLGHYYNWTRPNLPVLPATVKIFKTTKFKALPGLAASYFQPVRPINNLVSRKQCLSSQHTAGAHAHARAQGAHSIRITRIVTFTAINPPKMPSSRAHSHVKERKKKNREQRNKGARKEFLYVHAGNSSRWWSGERAKNQSDPRGPRKSGACLSLAAAAAAAASPFQFPQVHDEDLRASRVRKGYTLYIYMYALPSANYHSA